MMTKKKAPTATATAAASDPSAGDIQEAARAELELTIEDMKRQLGESAYLAARLRAKNTLLTRALQKRAPPIA